MGQYYENPVHEAAFVRFIDLMTKAMVKYGPVVLREQKKRREVHAKEVKSELFRQQLKRLQLYAEKILII